MAGAFLHESSYAIIVQALLGFGLVVFFPCNRITGLFLYIYMYINIYTIYTQNMEKCQVRKKKVEMEIQDPFTVFVCRVYHTRSKCAKTSFCLVYHVV